MRHASHASGRTPGRARWTAWLAQNPLVLLVGVLILLYLVTGAIQPGFLSFKSARNTLLQAAPPDW